MMNERLDLVIPENWESRIHSLLSIESQNPYTVLVLSETMLIAHQCFSCRHHGMEAKAQDGARPHAEGYKAVGLGLGLMHLQMLMW